MSRPLKGIQHPSNDGWHLVEQGVHVISLASLTEEIQVNDGAGEGSEATFLKLIQGGGVAVDRKFAD